MLPLIGLLGSVYLIFKGVEIYMQYKTSAREDDAGHGLAVSFLIIGVVLGLLFALMFLSAGTSVSAPTSTGPLQIPTRP